MQTLFDENGVLNIADIVSGNPRYKAIMEDGVVTEEELKSQVEQTVATLKKLQTLCNEEQQSAILDAISELSVLNAVYHNYQLQQIRM